MKGKIGLVPGELDLNMKRTLNSFMVTNCSLRISGHTIYLDIGLERLTDPYWMSLFIPTVSLILAAEITLFIDESQFKATIGVALTTGLVMQTIYNGIQEKLPENSSFKLIDAWLLHGTLMPMVVFVILACNCRVIGESHVRRMCADMWLISNPTNVTLFLTSCMKRIYQSVLVLLSSK